VKFFRFFASPVLLRNQSFNSEFKNARRDKLKAVSNLKRKKISRLKNAQKTAQNIDRI